jgi:ribosome modulation factor
MSEPLGGDPFAEGMDAFGRGVQLEECPYPAGSEERELWLDGWNEACGPELEGNPRVE